MKKIIFLAVLTLVSSFYALAGNKYQLKLKKGDSFVMTTKIEQKITQNVMGMEITIDLNVNAEVDLVVSELSKGEILFSQVYKSLMVSSLKAIDYYQMIESNKKCTDTGCTI